MAKNLQTFKKVTINGEDKILKFDLNAVCDLEEYFNKGIMAVMTEEQIGFRLLRAFYWAGLKWKEKGLTLEATGKMLTEEMQSEGGKNLMQLMEPAFDGLKKSGLLGSTKDDEEINPDDIEDEDKGEENPNE